MAAIDRDLVFLNHFSRALNIEGGTSASILEEIYGLVFEEVAGRERAVTFGNPSLADEKSLNRMISLFIQVIPRYAQLYQDPHAIPVTMYQRQKKLAIQLDQEFTKILWQKVMRAKVPGLLEDGKPIKDSFLDSPVLFMKEDARTKRFPKNKRGAIANVQLLIDRFQEKLTAKGINLESADNDGEERFTYGP